MKQYMPMKPTKWGIKVWECADFSKGYGCNLQVCTGKQDGSATEHGLGYCVVCDLTRPFLGKYHHVFCNNFLPQFPLLVVYFAIKLTFAGTIGSNRHDFPSSLQPNKAEVKALQKGESRFRRCGNLVATVWKDTKLVSFLSTRPNPVGDETVNRKQRDESVIQVPTVLVAVS